MSIDRTQMTKGQIALLVEILDHIVATSNNNFFDPADRIKCILNYIQFVNTSLDKSVNSCLNDSGGSLYQIQIPANPEIFLTRLLLPLVQKNDDHATLPQIVTALNDKLEDSSVLNRVKLHILNVENNILRNFVISKLTKDNLMLAKTFFGIRRKMIIDIIENSEKYFIAEEIPHNENVLEFLHHVYVDSEFKLYHRLKNYGEIIPFFDDVILTAQPHKNLLIQSFQMFIAANRKTPLLTAQAMREKIDRYNTSIDTEQFDRLEDEIDYGFFESDIKSLTIQMATPAFQDFNPKEALTVIQFILPFELLGSNRKIRTIALPDGIEAKVFFSKVESIYDDPTIMHLYNLYIGNNEAGIPALYLSDINQDSVDMSTKVTIVLNGFYPFDFNVGEDGKIEDNPVLLEEKALFGDQHYPHKVLSIQILRRLYHQEKDEFPLSCSLEDLNIMSFNNFLVEYKAGSNGVGEKNIHQKNYLMTNKDALVHACNKYSEEIGKLYRNDSQIGVKALIENCIIRTNESLRNFVAKTLEVTIKQYVEKHSCWHYLWECEKDDQKPVIETRAHPLINSYLRTIFEIKGVRVSREVRTANGAVDFFCSSRTEREDNLRVCVEVKNAHGSGLREGITQQLPAYMNAEQTRHGIYVVLWYKGETWSEPTKYKDINELTDSLKAVQPAEYMIDILVIDCTRPTSPSELKG